jgi:DNA-binding PadR family transcriptional regulator
MLMDLDRPATRKVLAVIMRDPHGEFYLRKIAALDESVSHQTVMRTLHALEELEWASSRHEDAEFGARRIYKLTPLGKEEVAKLLAGEREL